MSKKITQDQDIVFGIHPVLELLRAKKRKVRSIYTTKPTPKAWEGILPLIPSYVIINYVPKDALTKMAGTSDHQGIIAWAAPFIVRKKFFDAQQQQFLVMLDSLQDPRNVGAIIRSAYCTGANGIILSDKSSAPITGTVLKSSAGLAEHMDIFVANSSKEALLLLQKTGYTIYLSTLEKADDIREIEFKLPLCIVIGNEAVGINKTLLPMGIPLRLPQKTTDISYNASVAAGIFLFEIAIKNKLI